MWCEWFWRGKEFVRFQAKDAAKRTAGGLGVGGERGTRQGTEAAGLRGPLHIAQRRGHGDRHTGGGVGEVERLRLVGGHEILRVLAPVHGCDWGLQVDRSG